MVHQQLFFHKFRESGKRVTIIRDIDDGKVMTKHGMGEFYALGTYLVDLLVHLK